MESPRWSKNRVFVVLAQHWPSAWLRNFAQLIQCDVGIMRLAHSQLIGVSNKLAEPVTQLGQLVGDSDKLTELSNWLGQLVGDSDKLAEPVTQLGPSFLRIL